MNAKLMTIESLVRLIETEKKQNKTIVFTNGCFDICHAGHVRYLREAASKGDILVLGLNSDASVKQIKGDKRPVINQNMRAEVMSALEFVDYVVVFEDPDPYRLIEALRPDVLVKGADWEEKDIIGADLVKAGGGTIERVTLVPDISTTAIIEKIVKVFG